MFQKGHRFGHYRIESVLGEGGMGIVYEATDLERGGTIALKVVNPDIIVEPDEAGLRVLPLRRAHQPERQSPRQETDRPGSH